MDPKKQQIIAGVLVLAAAGFWVHGLMAKPARKNSAGQVALSAMSPEPVSTPDVPPRPALSADPAQADQWNDNPFLEERRRQPSGTAPEEGGLILNGIIWDLKAPAAVINDRVLSVGDKVGEWQVMEIQKDRVVVSDGTATRTLESQ